MSSFNFNIWAFCALLEMVVGIPGNIIVVYLISTDQNTRITTRLFMVTLAAFDCVLLLFGPSRYFILFTAKYDIRNISSTVCWLSYFTHGFFSDMAVYALCEVAIERFIVVAFPRHSHLMITVNSVVISIITVSMIMVIKSICMISLSKSFYENEKCQLDPPMWLGILDYCTFAVLPYLILLPCNLFIFFTLRHRRIALKRTLNGTNNPSNRALRESMVLKIKQQNMMQETAADTYHQQQKIGIALGSHKNESTRKKKKKPENAVKVLMALTVAHILSTLPGTIVRVLNLSRKEKIGVEVKNILTLFVYANNAITFFVYLITLSNFRRRVFRGFKFLGETRFAPVCLRQNSRSHITSIFHETFEQEPQVIVLNPKNTPIKQVIQNGTNIKNSNVYTGAGSNQVQIPTFLQKQ